MVAGMVFWGILEVIRLGVQAVFEMPITYSYLTALTSAMLIVTMFFYVKTVAQNVHWRSAVVLNIHLYMKMTNSSVLAAKS